VGGQERGPQIVVRGQAGVLVKHVADEADGLLRQRRQDVVVTRNWVHHVAKGELPLR
jgi:hypothetical protein